MIDRLTRNPFLLLIAFVFAGLVGAAVYASVRPVAADTGIEAKVREVILANPEIIPQAMERLRDRETGKIVRANRAGIVDPLGDAWKGAANADVTVVAYMDYACGYCRASLPMLDRLVASDPKVRVVFRELPILSQQSRTAAEWALAAAEQRKFRAFHDTLFAGGQLSQQSIDAAIVRAGLNRARGAAYARSKAATDELSKNLSLAGQLGMTGTPAWVVGDRVLAGAVTLEAMQAAVKAAREAG